MSVDGREAEIGCFSLSGWSWEVRNLKRAGLPCFTSRPSVRATSKSSSDRGRGLQQKEASRKTLSGCLACKEENESVVLHNNERELRVYEWIVDGRSVLSGLSGGLCSWVD
jgi:hypothetical protein